ncbi:RNA recognition motif domain-containing protein [Sulfuriflexus mobilis]|uniref:RNA recognition motif domain-containing protein n=1 Tax=Sulfuriflexus mobilis TaxID=1811807 RepID=UPI001559D327|nr:RNA-binding protein [Sulfuriflexus mobilis]
MEIFVGNLSSQVTDKDLQRFFKGYDKQASFKVMKLICNHGTLHYGVAEIEPEKLALKAIRKLNHKSLEGRHIILREFQYRAGNNDRRAMNWRTMPWNQLERRMLERRKKYQVNSQHDPVFSAYDNLASKGF